MLWTILIILAIIALALFISARYAAGAASEPTQTREA